jgi:hypothetical protein
LGSIFPCKLKALVKTVSFFDVTSVIAFNCLALIEILLNYYNLIKFLNITCLIVAVDPHTAALFHFEGIAALAQAEFCNK